MLLLGRAKLRMRVTMSVDIELNLDFEKPGIRNMAR